VGVTLFITRGVYAKPAAPGAPDWTLLLDRTLKLDDALPTLLESRGEFRALMEARVAAGLDPVREKQAAPARHWGALVVALILALMPLVFWRPAPDAPNDEPQQVAKDQPRPRPVQQNGGAPGNTEGGGGGQGNQKKQGPGKTGKGGGGKDGEVQKRPDAGKSEGTAGKKPDDVKPEQPKDSPTPKNGGIGDKKEPPKSMPKPPDEDVESKIKHVKPNAGDGDTRTEERSHWVYNPEGRKLDGSSPTPPDVQHPGEKAVPRTKLTTRERKKLAELYKKLYE